MKQIIAVASGKGGVGKSTVAVNLAVALANLNQAASGATTERPLRIALVDLDFYGPSVPTLMGGGEIAVAPDGKIVPVLKYQVKYISIAFFLKNPDDPIIWRGPMLGKGINQLFQDVHWGEVDLCIVDLPPGTGDAQLSLAQQVQMAGVVMVTTPQEVALADVRRAINMFRKVNVPVLGIVENMAGLKLPGGEIVDLFGSGGGQALGEQYGLPVLASLPLDVELRQGGDRGVPIALAPDKPVGREFHQLAATLLALLEASAESAPVLEVVN